MGTDPYVTEFQKEMAAVKASMVAMGVAIMAIAIPPGTKSGALAAKAAMAAEFAGMAALEARAEAAKLKMIDHINGIKHDDLAFGKTPKSASFEARKDDASLKPKDDRTFRGAGPEQARDAVHASPTSSAVRPALQRTNSPLSYNSAGGSPAVGFSAGMPMPTPGGTAEAGTIGVPAAPSASAAGGGGAGMGSSGVAPGASGASIGSDAKAGANPDPKTLSHNTSDVAAKAEAAKQKAAEEKKAAKEKAEQDEKQRKQQLQQMMMQGVQQAAQMVAQAAQQTKQKNEQQQGQADQAAASAPAP